MAYQTDFGIESDGEPGIDAEPAGATGKGSIICSSDFGPTSAMLGKNELTGMPPAIAS